MSGQHDNTENDGMAPTEDELRLAFRAGFRSIDEGDTFYTGFYQYLGSVGYRFRDDGPCTCSDGGAHGHLPECRWLKG